LPAIVFRSISELSRRFFSLKRQDFYEKDFMSLNLTIVFIAKTKWDSALIFERFSKIPQTTIEYLSGWPATVGVGRAS